ncbi:hypothetical protein HNR46_001582 [Haloferula luteola]|uniref:Uncharacterized protein n=1 Tax=Haloferula luteola TaxID=595692 RepID=A0A840V2R9_9BACT|nr:hypothetical protein [Haloferula luteola]MBB5351346.1 hypothetical protein [Haloferula luteola]
MKTTPEPEPEPKLQEAKSVKAVVLVARTQIRGHHKGKGARITLDADKARQLAAEKKIRILNS